jgi:hypothetical protein
MDSIGTTACNRPHQPFITYSAKGYEEYKAGLMQRLEANGFVLRDDDFIRAFVDLTAYLGEVLMTYQNAYSQEIYLETGQLRESLFNFAGMVDYRVDPGASATGTLVILAQPDKSGLLPQGFQVSGKEENAKKAVFFETAADLAVSALYNDFVLAESERYNRIEINSSQTSLTVLAKIVIRPGDYIYFHSTAGDFFTQVQGAAIDEKKGITTVSWAGSASYQTIAGAFQAGSGLWGLLNSEARGLLGLSTNTLYLDGKYEGIAVGDPLILKKKDASGYHAVVTKIESEVVKIKAGVVRWISQDAANSANDETELYNYTIQVQENGSSVLKPFYALEKIVSEVKEVTKLTLNWLGNSKPDDYSPALKEKSPDHLVYAGISKRLLVEEQTENQGLLNGAQMLLIDGDMSAMELDRLLILREDLAAGRTMETVHVKDVVYDSNTKQSYITLSKAVNNSFSKCGMRIWGNAVQVTEGKSVAATVLGSGQGERLNQCFALPQSPLTYTRAKGSIKPAITLTVDDLIWGQKDDFLDSGPMDRHFIVETGYDGQSLVVCGDGVSGARVPTGRDNVQAKFRIGLGQEGNVSAGVLKKPTLKPPFVKEVFNSGETGGGSDPVSETDLRARIPLEHLTFDRAVSLNDYADLALAYPGIGKARAGWRWLSNRQVVCLSVTGQGGKDPAILLDDLRAYLNARRDTNQPMRVEKVRIAPVAITIEAIIASGYDPDQVKASIIRTLGTGVNADGSMQFFNFDRLEIGLSIHQKDIHRLITNIPGVNYIGHLELGRTDTCPDSMGYMTPAYCSQDIWINNWELAALDSANLDVTVTSVPVNKVCKRLGG